MALPRFALVGQMPSRSRSARSDPCAGFFGLALPGYSAFRRPTPEHVRQRPSLLCKRQDRKSTRLNSSHLVTSYAVFCLKKNMLERGAFAGVDAAMMVHPGPAELIQMPCLAVSHFDVHYTGREAHASAFPEAGINAADALTVSQVGIGLLRQQFRSQDQVHGIVTKGGDAPNVIPAHTSAKYYVRAATLEDLKTLEARVRRCFEAGPPAPGTELEFDQRSPRSSEFVPPPGMQARYRRNAEALGRT